VRGSTHLVAGLCVGAAFAQSGNWPLSLAVGGMAALAPDWFQLNIPGANKIARGIVGHRGMSHWILTALVVWGMTRAAFPAYALTVGVAWISHILLDMFSGGCPALWPLPVRITLANIKTSSALDTWTGAALLVAAGAVVLWRIL
jgi:inner membrane protein